MCSNELSGAPRLPWQCLVFGWGAFCCEVMWTLRTTSSGVTHPMSSVCKGHYTDTLSSALHRLPSPNMASLDHFGSRTITSGLWQSTPSDMFMYLANLDSTWSTKRGCQGPPVVPAGCCHPHTLNESLVWLQQRFPNRLINHRLTRNGRRIHRTWTHQIFNFQGYFKNRVYDNNPPTIPDLKAAITAAIKAITREECGRVIENFVWRIQMCFQHG